MYKAYQFSFYIEKYFIFFFKTTHMYIFMSRPSTGAMSDKLLFSTEKTIDFLINLFI